MPRPQFSGVSFPFERVRGYNVSRMTATVGSVAAGASEIVDIFAPAGYVAQLIGLRMSVAAPPGAASGFHALNLAHGALPSTPISCLYGETPFNTDLFFGYRHWWKATTTAYPPGADAQSGALAAIRYDDTGFLRIQYDNKTNVASTDNRFYTVVVIERQVR